MYGAGAYEPLPGEHTPRHQPLHVTPLAQSRLTDPNPLRERAVLATRPSLIERGGSRWQAV